jgi:hypothetical protein
MEAWKSIEYYNISPVFALSATTERWGLGRFPPNVVATQGYWESVRHSKDTLLPAWDLPYSCSSPPDYPNSALFRFDGSVSISSSDKICTSPQVCPASGCIILVEGIGKTRTGPAHTSIIGLSHGIAFILATLITISITMGNVFSSCSKGQTEQSQSLRRPQRPNFSPYINPPGRRRTYTEQAMMRETTSKEVAKCSSLLRQLYDLELQIWSGRSIVDPGGIRSREEKKHRANALFVEIRRRINSLESIPNAEWSPEDLQTIEEIRRAVNIQNETRY